MHRWHKARKNMTKNTRDADVAFIQALAEVLRENDLTEVKVKREYGEDDSLDVRVSRQQPQQVVAQVATAAPAAVAPAAAPTAAAPVAAAASADPASDPGAVTSPMVGTVYLAAEPGAAAFVSVGTVVAEGDDSGGDEDGSGGGGGGETTPRASTGTVPFEEGVTSHLAAAAPADP